MKPPFSRPQQSTTNAKLLSGLRRTPAPITWYANSPPLTVMPCPGLHRYCHQAPPAAPRMLFEAADYPQPIRTTCSLWHPYRSIATYPFLCIGLHTCRSLATYPIATLLHLPAYIQEHSNLYMPVLVHSCQHAAADKTSSLHTHPCQSSLQNKAWGVICTMAAVDQV